MKVSGNDIAFTGICFSGEYTLGEGSVSSLKPTSISGDRSQARVSVKDLVRILTDGNKICHREGHKIISTKLTPEMGYWIFSSQSKTGFHKETEMPTRSRDGKLLQVTKVNVA